MSPIYESKTAQLKGLLKSVGIVFVLAFVVGIPADMLQGRWHKVHDQTFHMTGTVISSDLSSGSFVLSRIGGFASVEEYHVDGDMPLGTGKCFDIEYRPRVLFGFFQSSDYHQIEVIRASSPTDNGAC